MTDGVQGQELVVGRLLRKWLHKTAQARDDGSLKEVVAVRMKSGE